MSDARFTGTVQIDGQLTLNTASIGNDHLLTAAAIARSKLAVDSLQQFGIDLNSLRTHDNLSALLPGTPATDDLGLVDGTFGTDAASIQTEDLDSAGLTTNRARFLFAIPAEYAAGQTLNLRLHAGMLTNIADATATVDVEVYKSDEEGAVGSDLCTTAATTINSLVLSDKDFTITPTGFSAGDLLDVRISTAVNDAATGAAVKAIIGAIKMLVDIQG